MDRTLKREIIVPIGAHSYLQDLTPIKKKGKNDTSRVASPETVTVHLYCWVKVQRQCDGFLFVVYTLLRLNLQQQTSTLKN